MLSSASQGGTPQNVFHEDVHIDLSLPYNHTPECVQVHPHNIHVNSVGFCVLFFPKPQLLKQTPLLCHFLHPSTS
uniref:Uncharacterized protein n=1 Tax=Arundo donax TaxID=35708 RepID=A0A0A9D0F9_ARUDO